jgi:hypothetical protein
MSRSSFLVLHPLRLVTLLLVVMGADGRAADRYLTPEGGGSRDGSSWENAAPGTRESFQAAWDALAPGDTLHVGGGAYGARGG